MTEIVSGGVGYWYEASYNVRQVVGEGRGFIINGAYEFVCVTDFGVNQPSGGRFTVVHPLMHYTQHAGDGLQSGQLALHARSEMEN